jgi:hypothetical protein
MAPMRTQGCGIGDADEAIIVAPVCCTNTAPLAPKRRVCRRTVTKGRLQALSMEAKGRWYDVYQGEPRRLGRHLAEAM